MAEPTPGGGDGTIVVITRNRSARAADTVDRLLGLSDGWPVVVVDDASDDDTAMVMRQRFGGHIRLLSLPVRRGAAARTAGVELAGTPFVAFSDDDSWWAEGSLARAACTFRSHPGVGLIAATVVVEPAGHPDPIVSDLATSPLRRSDLGPSVLGFLACGSVVRTAAYLDVGGFEPLLDLGGEEELLALDLRAAGWDVVHLAAVVAHHHPLSDDTGREDRPARLTRNQLLVQWMRRPVSTAARATASAMWTARSDPGVRRGVRDALVRLPPAIRHRRRLPDWVERDIRLVEKARR